MNELERKEYFKEYYLQSKNRNIVKNKRKAWKTKKNYTTI